MNNLGIYTYRLQTLLNEAKNILIFLTRQPDLDQTASALSLYLSLSQSGKSVKIVCPDKITVEKSNLFAVDQITDNLDANGRNLIISFPYVEGSIEKVSYNIEDNRFNLVIEPKGEANAVDEKNVQFYRSGGEAEKFDLIFTIGVANLNDLGKFQNTHRKLLEQKNTVVINNKKSEIPFGVLKIINLNNVSISELVALLMARLNLPIDHDIAGNLLTGIKEKTANFSQNATADSFEAAAICTRRMTKESFPPPQPLTGSPFVQKKAPADWLKPKIFRSSNSSTVINNKGTLL